MLYDNGPLLSLYASAWQATGEAAFREVAERTGEWLLREMRAPEGGFWSTLDADSEGEEGRFYLWTREEARAVLAEEEYAVAAGHFGLDGPANFEGRWHLRVARPLAEVAASLGIPELRARALRDAARKALFATRRRRTPPGRDEKILTAWNALAIRGLACAGRLLGRDDFITAAAGAVDFIRRHLYHEGRLYAGIKDGRLNRQRFLDDHAFLIDALLELLQARFRPEDLQFATELADTLLTDFQDALGGGFFLTPTDHETLILRPKPVSDDAIPSGNGIAAKALLRLGHLLGETRYLEAAEATLHCAWENLRQYASLHGALLDALEEYLQPPAIIVLRGEADAFPAWLARLQADYRPRRLVFAVPRACTDLPASLANRPAPENGVTAWICHGNTCQPPVRQLDDLPI